MLTTGELLIRLVAQTLFYAYAYATGLRLSVRLSSVTLCIVAKRTS